MFNVHRHRLHTNDEDFSFKQSRWFVVIAFTWPHINLDTINSIDFNFISVMCRWDYITYTPSRTLNYKSKGERVMKPFVFCQLTVNQFIVPWNGQEMATHRTVKSWISYFATYRCPSFAYQRRKQSEDKHTQVGHDMMTYLISSISPCPRLRINSEAIVTDKPGWISRGQWVRDWKRVNPKRRSFCSFIDC